MARETLSEVFDFHRDAIHRDLRCAMPGEVHSFDPIRGSVDVQPMIPDHFSQPDGSWKTIFPPIITDCPVIWPGGGGYRIKFALKPGDRVWIVWCDRDYSAWFQQGKQVDPGRWARGHHIKDGFVIPSMLEPLSEVTPLPEDGIWIGKKDGTEIVIDSTGVKLGGQDADQAVIRGNAYRSAEDALLSAIITAIGVVAAAAAIAANPTNTTEITAAVTTATNAFSPLGIAKSNFDAAAASYLSALVKAK
jgi:hypothetical protein